MRFDLVERWKHALPCPQHLGLMAVLWGGWHVAWRGVARVTCWGPAVWGEPRSGARLFVGLWISGGRPRARVGCSVDAVCVHACVGACLCGVPQLLFGFFCYSLSWPLFPSLLVFVFSLFQSLFQLSLSFVWSFFGLLLKLCVAFVWPLCSFCCKVHLG